MSAAATHPPFLLLVIPRLVRGTHDLRVGGFARRRRVLSCATEFMDGPDKPGHDER